MKRVDICTKYEDFCNELNALPLFALRAKAQSMGIRGAFPCKEALIREILKARNLPVGRTLTDENCPATAENKNPPSPTMAET